MNAHTNLERRVAEHYAGEPPLRAPDRVLHAALATIETTPQRRGVLAPWRFAQMNTYAKLAAAAAVVAVVAFGVWQLAPGPGPGGPGVTPSPSPVPTLAPTPASTARPLPTPSAYVPPELTGTFTSDVHGITISYPAGWATQAATEAWTGSDSELFGSPAVDSLYDPVLADHLFLRLGSQPLGSASFEAWSAQVLAAEGCAAPTEPVAVDGAAGVLALECNLALVAAGGRGYVIALFVSSDEAELRLFEAEPWFRQVLATVQLQPADAVD